MKILGWILLAGGLIIIFYSLLVSYNIFTGKSLAPAIFLVEQENGTEAMPETASPAKQKTQDLKSQTEDLLEKQLQEQLKGLIPTDYLPKLLNLISWSVFAGILILGGAQISGLGIRLLTARK